MVANSTQYRSYVASRSDVFLFKAIIHDTHSPPSLRIFNHIAGFVLCMSIVGNKIPFKYHTMGMSDSSKAK